MKDHIEYNESLYFNCHDETNDVTAFMRIGNKPNKNEKSLFFVIMTPEVIYGFRHATPCEGDPNSIGGLTFSKLPSGAWSLTYRGIVVDMKSASPTPIPASMDIEWKPQNPEMDYKRCVNEAQAAMSAKVASEHLEQFGIADGTLTIGDKQFKIHGTGERDFSAGVRDWGSPKMWAWINSVFLEKEAFNITKLSTDMGDVDAGYFFTKGDNQPLNRVSIDLRSENGVPSSFTLKMKDVSGSSYEVEGKVIRFAALPMGNRNEMMLIETISEYVWDGKKGFGIAEFLVRRRDRRLGPFPGPRRRRTGGPTRPRRGTPRTPPG